MRGMAMVLIAALGLALAAAATTSSAATKVEVQQATERIDFELTPGDEFHVYVEISPLLGIVEIWTEKGPRGGAREHGRRSTVAYAARISAGPAAGSLNVDLPGVGSIVGELVPLKKTHGGAKPAGCHGPDSSSETVKLRGSFDLTGAGDYLKIDTDYAEGEVARTPELRCKLGAAENPRAAAGLFEYIEGGLGFSNQNTAILFSEKASTGRVVSFLATHEQDGDLASFAAQTREWLPGHIATKRIVEALGVRGADFTVSSKAKHPAWAAVSPPTPFSGSASYSRARARGKFTGSLAVQFLGKRLRLAGRQAKAQLFDINPGF